MNMKRFVILLLGLMTCLQGWSRGISYGPWVTESREDRMTICWLSEKPGMAYVELSDGTQVWDTFAGRRIFKRLHTVTIDGLEPGKELGYRVCGQDLVDDRMRTIQVSVTPMRVLGSMSGPLIRRLQPAGSPSSMTFICNSESIAPLLHRWILPLRISYS